MRDVRRGLRCSPESVPETPELRSAHGPRRYCPRSRQRAPLRSGHMQHLPDDREAATRSARRLLTDLQPESVLDVRSDPSVLVDALRDLDVDASRLDGTDALGQPLDRKYDLV